MCRSNIYKWENLISEFAVLIHMEHMCFCSICPYKGKTHYVLLSCYCIGLCYCMPHMQHLLYSTTVSFSSQVLLKRRKGRQTLEMGGQQQVSHNITWIIKRRAAQQGCFDEASTRRKIGTLMLMMIVTESHSRKIHIRLIYH